MNRVAEDVDRGELGPLDAFMMMMAMQESVLVPQQLLHDEEEQHAGEDEQRGPERTRPASVREDLGNEMDERIAEERAGGEADEEGRQPPHARAIDPIYEKIISSALLHSTNDPS